ncbi:CPBP family intramembrane glutamic endopeptidase [Bacillus sp. 165]|uniref:CPBP family intramembrane glutamic endopeptidase n=1 Tax=Bacillus sp. 165 TaxID=1529117 RepID=UPI001ADC7BB8|nr:CPBP family intramembrane glutamic endopeptidase [Bacillus sp. 165]MBO9131421.1 CPBP family intramembrane metalloprotease [Bacillus sp. 165]
MEKRYWFVILTYVLMQLSSAIGVPLLIKSGLYEQGNRDIWTQLKIASGHWAIISFVAALLIILFLLRKDIQDRHLDRSRADMSGTIGWMIGGVFLALIAQMVAANIEVHLLNIKAQSENTKNLIEIVTLTPWFILVTSVLAPILEEIVFRKILFGTLYKRTNFFIAAILSSLIFAAVHFDFTHLLIYTSMGFVFAYLYVKTKRIIVPIMAHVMMNTFVILIQVVFKDDIEQIMKQAEQLQSSIGGF